LRGILLLSSRPSAVALLSLLDAALSAIASASLTTDQQRGATSSNPSPSSGESSELRYKRGLAVEDMVKSRWVYRKLRNFRAGIEAGISCLKRAYGLARCTWRGLDHFKTYIWSAVVAHNLVLLARLKPA
jgi:transposase, IS5 family